MNGKYATLAGTIRAELIDLERAVERAERLLAKARLQSDDDYLDGVALNLHGFYSGVEHIFDRIARTVDTSRPEGAHWHREILMQMCAEVTGIRPPVIRHNVRRCLDEYRGFRHIVRNVYTFNLRPLRLEELVTELRPCYQSVMQDLEAFCNFLEGGGKDNDD